MRYRLRLFLMLCAVALLALAAMTLIQAVTVQRDHQERTVSVVRDVAALRGALEEGLVEYEVYAAWYERAFGDGASTVWLVDPSGAVLPADAPADFGGGFAQLHDAPPIARAFSAHDIEQYLEPSLRGESQVVMGDMGGRLGELSVTVIEPVVRMDGSVRSVLFVGTKVDASQGSDVFWILRQSLPAFLCAAALGLLAAVAMSAWMAKPIERLAGMEPKERGNDIAKLSREMARMQEQIDELEDLRKGFVSNVSHELRAPLTNVMGYLQSIVDGAVREEDRDRYLDIALEEARRMSALIGDLLNLSRIESGRFPLEEERFDICEMLRRALVAGANSVEEKGIRVNIEFKSEGLFVRADPRWIRLAIDNILGNAVKFAGEGGNILLRVQPTRERVYVTIADDGPGIAPADIEHVFEWFYKADKAHSTSGTGLGLAIVRSIMDRHGQAVRISSQEGKGTMVVFTLAVGSQR